ncbi:uncharacterized protein [Spinacia oleracea]|uniref:Uncharacterized protein isoform X2 n=1 Tax=Spinacia oleracea TaxID=3562 RepID=A0ABM3QKL8_SPIOL|nr:uncharacterized protein LOC110789890 isoform X2 [Spinacia oleracea]
MGDPQNPNKDKPCEICGRVGWVEPLTVCSKCKVTREHRYCMRVAYNGDQEKWVCEECDSSNQIPSAKPASSKQPSGSGIKLMMKKPPPKVQYITPEEAIGLESGAMRSNLSPPNISQFRHRPSANKRSSTPPAKFTIKPNPPVGPSGRRDPLNDRSMPNGSKDKNVSASTDGSARKHYGESPTAKRVTFEKHPKIGVERDNINPGHTSVQLSQCLPAISSDGHAQQPCIKTPTSKRLPDGKLSKYDISSGHTSQLVQPFPTATSDGCAQQPCIKTPTDKHFPDGKLPKDDINSGHTSPLLQPFPTVTSVIDDVCTGVQQKKIDSKECESLRDTGVLAASPTWKGIFKIINDVKQRLIFEDIQARLPCKVHRKVYDLLRKFPEILSFEMLPRKDFWEDIFQEVGPSELDIGLYFLSSRMSNLGEQSYCSLLEYLDKHDFLLKSTYFDEVELLVFSSIHLPVDSCKINQKHFLWGLFRPSKDNIVVSEPSESGVMVDTLHSQEHEAKYMDIDMPGPSNEVKPLPKSAGSPIIFTSDTSRVQQSLSEEHEAEDMEIDMLGGEEFGIDRVVPKSTENSSGNHTESENRSSEPSRAESGITVDAPRSSDIKQVQQPISEVKPSAKSVVSPVKIVKRDCTGVAMEASPSSSHVENEGLEFEKELQRNFDWFASLVQVNEAGLLKRDVKVEADAS